MKKIRGLQVENEDKLISFDVKSLFTKVPIDLSLQIIDRRLREDNTLSDRTTLDPPTITMLTELCLRTTYFQYGNEFFEQKDGAAMGSPLSPVVANIFMEEFENEALQEAGSKPRLWLRYVDDTFVIWSQGRDQLEDFLSFLNGRHGNIQFTMEEETDGSIPFLDVLVKKNKGRLSTSVYRKPTHTDRYLHFSSHHHPRVKAGIALCLRDRAEKICGAGSSVLQEEKEHLKGVLQANGYPSKVAARHMKKRQRNQGSREDGKRKLFIPYVKGLSEMISRTCRKMNIETIFTKQRSLRSILSRPKQPQPTMDIKGVIYQIPCSSCPAVYTGETGRTLKVRMVEHKRAVRMGDVNNGLAVHSLKTGHPIEWSQARVVEREENWYRRRIKEALKIQQCQVRMNLDQGIVLRSGWKPFFMNTPFTSPPSGNDVTDDITDEVIKKAGKDAYK